MMGHRAEFPALADLHRGGRLGTVVVVVRNFYAGVLYDLRLDGGLPRLNHRPVSVNRCWWSAVDGRADARVDLFCVDREAWAGPAMQSGRKGQRRGGPLISRWRR